MIKAWLTIEPEGFKIVIVPPATELPYPAPADEMADPRVGLMTASSSTSTFVKSVNQLFRLGTGQDHDIVQYIEQEAK